MKMSITDYSFALMDSVERPLDFALIVELKNTYGPQDLEAGAIKAFQIFPRSNSLCRGKSFTPALDAYKLEVKNTTTSDLHESIKVFLKQPFFLYLERGVKQLYLKNEEKITLVTRFHHAIGDGVSMFLWLKAQLGFLQNHPYDLILKQSPYKIKVSKYMDQPSDLWRECHGKASAQREWSHISFPLPKSSHFKYGFSYNDLLCAILFKAMRWYDNEKGIRDKYRGIYLPMNIRSKNPFQGFGNGSSRIKIYDLADFSLNYFQLAKNIREQVNWCRKNGLWNIPQKLGVLNYIPNRINKKIINNISMKPSTDFGSLIFSHLENFGELDIVFDQFLSVVLVSQLFKTYPMSLVAVSFKNQTALTCTWDEPLIPSEDIKLFLDLIKQAQKEAFDEMSLC